MVCHWALSWDWFGETGKVLLPHYRESSREVFRNNLLIALPENLPVGEVQNSTREETLLDKPSPRPERTFVQQFIVFSIAVPQGIIVFFGLELGSPRVITVKKAAHASVTCTCCSDIHSGTAIDTTHQGRLFSPVIRVILKYIKRVYPKTMESKVACDIYCI
jgi:hypothetical protein